MDKERLLAHLTNYARYEMLAAPQKRIFAHSLRFYLGQFRIVRHSSQLAKQGRYTNEVWADASYATLRHIERFGGRFCITGLQHLQALKPPVVFVANHMSTLENFVLPVLLLTFTPITFVVKRSLLTYPVFGRVMRAIQPIVVDRVNPKRDFMTVMSEGEPCLKQGRSVVVFPQATRRNIFRETEFNTIGEKLASRANVPVVPIALKTDFWSSGKGPLKDFGPIYPERKIYFEFGPPMSAHARTTHEAIVGFISSRLAQWT